MTWPKVWSFRTPKTQPDQASDTPAQSAPKKKKNALKSPGSDVCVDIELAEWCPSTPSRAASAASPAPCSPASQSSRQSSQNTPSRSLRASQDYPEVFFS